MSAEDIVQPEPSNWRRTARRGSLNSSQQPIFTGWIEAPVFATNFDVLIDFGSATYPSITFFFAAIYAQSVYGAGKTYRAQYGFSVTGGVFPIVEPTGAFLDPSWSTMRQCGGIGGQQFLLHAGGLAAVTWGLELLTLGINVGPGVENLIVSAISHGREVGG